MRYVISALILTFVAAVPAFAQSEQKGAIVSAEVVQPRVAAPATPAPATETKQGSSTLGGSGLMLNTNSMLGIHPRQQ